ncbi:Transposase family tnp2, partial [Rhizoctonia solani]
MDLDSELDSDNNNNNSFNMGVEIAHYKENDLLPANVDFSELEDPPQQNPGDLGHFKMPSLSLDEPPLLHNLIHHNPPVNIQTWPDPPSDDPDSNLEDELELSCQIINGPDCNPKYVERDNVDVPHVNPNDKPRLTEEEMRKALEFDFGNMLDNEWVEMWLETCVYDCCINSCVCYLGKYQELDKCPFCQEPRCNGRGKARRVFHYTPLIPQLQGLFQNAQMAKKLRYRVESDAKYKPHVIFNVFDSDNYLRLQQTQVHPNHPYHFFDNPKDIALGLLTDGFMLFKRRRRGLSCAWPIILINYNLDPSIRTHLENIICVGVIPGPKQPKDINSFFIPLLNELLELQQGVSMRGILAEPKGILYEFVLRAFIIIIFGDILAISKLMMIKGHNAFLPCRTCLIEGQLCQLKRTAVYYLGAARTQAKREEIARNSGINGEPIFTQLRSINLPSNFPYNIMHLLFKNLVPNMVKHWTGDFKGLDKGTGTYRISKAQWMMVGLLTARATQTIPSVFVGTLPDIAQDQSLFKAEAYSFWIQYLAPILLKDVMPQKYYNHVLALCEIILLCLQFKITRIKVDKLQAMINNWVLKYEMYYYQYQTSQLPTCPLTIHALLHIPYYILQTGPLWASWAFVMERFCGRLLPAVRNCTRPYIQLDNYIERRAQLQLVAKKYDIPTLTKAYVKPSHPNE